MLLKLTTTVVVFLVWVPVASAWSWPVKGLVLQSFSYDESHPYTAGQHRGIDIGANATGAPVVAPESGTVSFAGFVATSGESLTIETADGYSVTLTHLGSIGVTKGASVAEGDVVGAVGPSGTPEQSVPYLHLGVRLTADPLGYLDPLGLLPAPEPAPAPTPSPTPAPRPVQTPVPVVPSHTHGGGLVIERPSIPAPTAVVHHAEPARPAQPEPKPLPVTKPVPSHAARPAAADLPHIRLPFGAPIARPEPVVVEPLAQPTKAEPLVLSIAPGIVAALLAVLTAFARSRRPAPLTTKVVQLRKEVPLRRAA